jgi:hypothetical protein
MKARASLDGEKRTKGSETPNHEVQHVIGGNEIEKEANNAGAIGKLTGADDHAG